MAVRTLIRALEGTQEPVYGERFIGRNSLVEELVDYFYLSKRGKNYSICGLPRIGKTSVIKQAFWAYKHHDEYDAKHIGVYIDINGQCRGYSPSALYSYILHSALKEIDDLSIKHNNESFVLSMQHRQILRRLVETLDSLVSDDLLLGRNIQDIIEDFLKICYKEGVCIRLVLDEFDAIHHSFIENGALNIDRLNGFYAHLRVLISSSDKFSIKVVIISRNDLPELEPDGVESTLSGVCESISLGLFSNEDMNQYWERLKRYDADSIITEEYVSYIEKYAGHFPYWLDVANEIYLKQHGSIKTDIDVTIRQKIKIQYDSILRMLDESKYLSSGNSTLKNKLLQVIVGPNYDLTADDVEKLIRYGIISVNSEGDYSVFSETFKEYVEVLPLEKPIWETLSHFETRMRVMLIEKYVPSHVDWESRYTEIYGKQFVSRLYRDQEKNRSFFGDRAISNIINCLRMSDYSRFIETDWEWFKDVFSACKGDKSILLKQLEYLTNVRNPYAHSNARFFTESDIKTAELHCSSLIQQIDAYLSKI